MKNQAIKEKSGLVLEKLSENELDTICGGENVLDGVEDCLEFVEDGAEKWLTGFISIPNAFWGMCMGKDLLNADTTVDCFDSGCIFVGALAFIGLLDVVLGGIYYGVCKVNKKLKRRFVKKVVRRGALVTADENGLRV